MSFKSVHELVSEWIPCDNPEKLKEKIKNECISLPHRTYVIDGDSYTATMHHNDIHKSRYTPGVYLQYDVNHPDIPLYIGKASGETSGVGIRNGRHDSSFEDLKVRESSGKHMRKYMLDRGLDTVVMSAKYFDMSGYPPGMIEMIEYQLIDQLNPINNKEGK